MGRLWGPDEGKEGGTRKGREREGKAEETGRKGKGGDAPDFYLH